MSNDRTLRHGPAPDAFADGAARFAELARAVKAQQTLETQGMSGAEGRMAAPPPDEMWSAKYCCQAIGPSGAASDTAMMCAPVSHTMQAAPDVSELQRSYRPVPAATHGMSAARDLRPAPMTVRLGRESRPRRSWLVRLWKGR